MLEVEALVYNSFQVNTYLVKDQKGHCLVVDPAFHGTEEIAAFEAAIAKQKLQLIGQLNTHCHVDHILGCHYLKDNYAFPLRAHTEESALLGNAPLMGEIFGLKVERFQGIDEEIRDGSILSVGEEEIMALHVPGHSPGSLAFYSEEGAFVITGDALFEGSIGRTDLPGGDYDTLIRSIRERLFTLPAHTLVYPGHGGPSSIGRERMENPFLRVAE